jgi:hypothetical protein
MELKSLTQRSECVGVKSGCFRILRECLVCSSMRLGVLFIAPRQLGAVEDQLGRLILPSVGWRTRQSGAPPDSYCSCPVLDFFPYREQPTRLAHRTVRCAQPTVGTTTCRVADRWRGHVSCGRPLAQATVSSPDSPVNYSHVAPLQFPRATSSLRMTHRTVRCTTGQSGEL